MGTDLTETEMLERILNLENELKKYEQINLEPKHYFGGGVYARELFIPKDTMITGKMHKEDNISVMLYGDIQVATEDGVRRINEPCVIVSKAGVKRACYTFEDTCWLTFHGTQETDLEEIEKLFIVDDPQEYLEEKKRLEAK